MSLDALRWAMKARPGSSSKKLLLITLADRANENHECFPSHERLQLDTDLNHKTIKKCLAELISDGYIKDTGRRVGKTQRVKVYCLVGVYGREEEASQEPADNKTKNGPVKSDQKRNDSKNGINPILDSNEAKNGPLESDQKRSLEPPSVLTTQSNHPASCSHPADAAHSPPDENTESSVEPAPDETPPVTSEFLMGEVITGWTIEALLDPPSRDPDNGNFIALPLRADQTPLVHIVSDQQVVDYGQIYQGIDVPGEFRAMLGWLMGHPERRKTSAGISRFINGWLNKARADQGSPYLNKAPALVGYEKTGGDQKARRERVRAAMRDITNTDW